MLTARGWWLLLVSLFLLTLAVIAGAATLAVIAFTLLVWLLGQWLAFAIRMRRVHGKLRVARELATEHGPTRTLWAGVPATVHVVVQSDSAVSLEYVSIVDRVPVLAHRREGNHFTDGPLTRESPLRFSYRIECPAPGPVRFEGVRVQFADLHGFFSHIIFLRDPRSYRALPAIATGRGRIPAQKRQNTLPLLGTHPHRRPGSGSDLLDLRDYLPGDPPKMIAWKASARRDRLMTKELESEVPIRATLFVDCSNSVRLGALGSNALARLMDIAAAITHANAAVRDLTWVCLFDERRIRALVRPGRGSRHLLHITHALSDSAGLMPDARGVPLERLLPLAYGLVQDVYPERLERDVNAVPAWLPFWVAARQLWWFWTWPFRAAWTVIRRRSLLTPLGEGLRRLANFGRLYRWRKQIAAVFAVKYDLGPGGTALLLEDDDRLRDHMIPFLVEHQVPSPMRLYDEQGRYLFASVEKVGIVADALLASVLRGRDNELFVLLVDLFDVGDRMERLLRAVRVAIARHHQVIVICPWPKGAMPPGRDTTTSHRDELPDLQQLLARASEARLRQSYDMVREAFARMAVPVICAAEDQAVDLILHRIQQLRVMQRGSP